MMISLLEDSHEKQTIRVTLKCLYIKWGTHHFEDIQRQPRLTWGTPFGARGNQNNINHLEEQQHTTIVRNNSLVGFHTPWAVGPTN